MAPGTVFRGTLHSGMSFRRSVLPAILFYFGFAGTGVCVAAPGTLLPLMSSQRSLTDAAIGILLFGFFAGSTVGGLCARGPLRILLPASCAVGVLSTYTLASRSTLPPLLCFTTLGLALGIMMTSITLQQSRANPATRVAVLSRLNLIWAAGALAGPFLCLRISRAAHGPEAVFLAMAVMFAVLGMGLLALPAELWRPPQAPAMRLRKSGQIRLLLPLLLSIPLATGMEASAGGWLTTYGERSGFHLAGGVGLTSVFWAGLLLCRFTYAGQRIARRAVANLRLQSGIALVGVGLLASGSPLLLFPGALCFGWGLGSVYPTVLALLLNQRELGNAGFFIAGLGGSSLPLSIGFIAQKTHSIQAGIAALLLPALCMLIFTGAATASRETHEIKQSA